eukprot:PhM_4_TR9248/c0_g1_i2/m.24379/K07918/RAB32; Ras-related protein Rab-32
MDDTPLSSPVTTIPDALSPARSPSGPLAARDVQSWLVHHSLQEYSDVLRAEGFDDLEDLRQLVRRRDHFQAIVPKLGHQIKFRRLLLPKHHNVGNGAASVAGSAASEAHSMMSGRMSSVYASSWREGQRHSSRIGSWKMDEDEPRSLPATAFVYKIIVVGEHNTGKTSFITRLVDSTFGSTLPTLGVDFREKSLQFGSIEVRVQLCDISGLERFCNLTKVYYQNARGALVFYDVTNARTFEMSLNWKKDVDAKVFAPDGTPIPSILVGSKSDLKDSRTPRVVKGDIQEYVREHKYAAHFETSSKTGFQVNETIENLVAMLLKEDLERMDAAKQSSHMNNGNGGDAESIYSGHHRAATKTIDLMSAAPNDPRKSSAATKTRKVKPGCCK